MAKDDERSDPEALDLGWAWIENDTGRAWVLGASADSPAQAWVVALAASDIHTVQELRAAERWREAGQHVALLRASLELCKAWAEHGCRVGWRLYKGTAVTRAEHALLTANEDRASHRTKERLN